MNRHSTATPLASSDAIGDAEETYAAETLDQPPGHDEALDASRTYPPFSFPVVVLLAPASTFGVLARLGLIALTTYDGQCIFPLAYVQALGCFIMGFTLRLKEPIGQFYGPLYTAITTGFCGSLTTFSSWQLDVFNSWINAGGYHRSGLQAFIDGLGKTVYTLTLSIGSLIFGYTSASHLHRRLPRPRFAPRPFRHTLSVISILFYAATFPAYFRLSARFRAQATAALLFAFPGALTRYILSILLNQRIKALPLGTLTANSTGTALLGAFHVVQSIPHPVGMRACAILQGLGDGYCGCLTTVSTFAAEMRDLGAWKAWRYGVMSWVVGQVLLLIIIGSSVWAGGAEKQITCQLR